MAKASERWPGAAPRVATSGVLEHEQQLARARRQDVLAEEGSARRDEATRALGGVDLHTWTWTWNMGMGLQGWVHGVIHGCSMC